MHEIDHEDSPFHGVEVESIEQLPVILVIESFLVSPPNWTDAYIGC